MNTNVAPDYEKKMHAIRLRVIERWRQLFDQKLIRIVKERLAR